MRDRALRLARGYAFNADLGGLGASLSKRRRITGLALLSVLLHALALVDHNGAMLRMALADPVPGFDYGVICRGDGSRLGLTADERRSEPASLSTPARWVARSALD